MKLERKSQHTISSSDQGNAKCRAIENEFKAECLIRYQLKDGSTASCIMLQSGKKGAESLQFIFGWTCKGLHTSLTPRQEEDAFDAIEAGLKDLPEGERITFHMGSFASDAQRQLQLDQLIELAPTPQLKFLIMSEKQRVQDLTWKVDHNGVRHPKGLRKPKFLRVYATYTISSETVKGTDIWEKILLKLESLFHKFTGFDTQAVQQSYEIAFEKAFTDGYLNYQQLLDTKMRLETYPMDVVDLWVSQWQIFNKTETPPVPQILHVTETGIREEINSDVHFTTLLLHSGSPKDDRAWVHVNGNYVAPLVFLDKPGGWSTKFNQLSYLWQTLSREPVVDTEVFCQISKANQGIVKDNMRRVMKQSLLDQSTSIRKNTIDVAASLRQTKTVKAQEALYEGGVVLQTATVFLVHRPTVHKLDEACRYLKSCFLRPAWVDREREYAWKIWLQTLLITWDGLLIKPFDRRLGYLTSEAPGMMPVVTPREIDRSGFELITEEGGVPLHLNFYTQSQPRNFALFGTTRSGKSVLTSGILSQALAYKIPVIIMDFPPSEAASTFRDWCRYLGGSYFDISKEANNLFEIPDLSGFNDEEYAERMPQYIDFLQTAVMTLVFGGKEPTTSDDRNFRQSIRSILGPAIARFFDDSDIKARYAEAHRAGLNTEAWLNMPTLRDFFEFFKAHGTDGLSESTRQDDTTKKSVSQIERQLVLWIDSTTVGRAIARPSTFRTDNPLLVFALQGLSDSEDAAVLALSAYAAALRRTLSHRRSIFFIDEFSVLMEWEEIANLIARLCANGGKAGIETGLAAQDPNTLLNSPEAGPKIIQNISTRLIGRIQPVAISSFCKFFGYPLELISVNAGERFYPQASEMYSQWLLDEGGRPTFVRYYGSPILVGVVANNPDQTECRQAFLQAYPNPYQALAAWSKEFIAATKNQRPYRKPELAPTPVETDPLLNTLPSDSSVQSNGTKHLLTGRIL
ncbi:hypothetical protein NIES2135_61900 (plasmid) [Leptolyngbya boryana NIES-2135]|jgi:hypothetical protein|uniref:Helicase HerA central domain-containing protein n=1 Tax=Leptolyngbya boryana NIES-2135 TaxID=1973484 RepID=A0A1Z4JRM1_LEPBY|nr:MULTISPECIES: hypothetical protein [Leptolyngbya]BAY59313.1 hypothetical protein NIES2135_61900 [Leptolyngbya boryana NIES-2135]MBD2372902.1 hypothetical protein [Leptolyngbya sp. FACHB-238]MBD2397345.1 hypothetical protein [Leptolyngbya sp. FACHB-239]MBD2403850.1 hypothetical protein [Leptolyngbya sp. FACHB-402]ULP33505.1 hypothetical protein MCP04_30725 [Leptolyngbya boryana IU 594]